MTETIAPAPGATAQFRARALTALAIASAVLALNATGVAVWAGTKTARLPSAIRVDEVTAQRVNVVEPDGQPRLVLANDPKSPGGTVDGKVVRPDGGRPGMVFFDGKGNEVGGLSEDTHTEDGHPSAFGQLSFDQYRQDQTLTLSYGEGDGKRSAGLTVQDRPDTPISEMISEYQRIQALPAGAQKTAAMAQLEAKYPAPKRVFVGKGLDGRATLMLADDKGRPRLTLTVDKDGSPEIQFLDAHGKITKTVE